MKKTPSRRAAAADRRFRALLSSLRGQKGALIPLLQGAQEIYGYLPVGAMRRIARALRLSPSEVFGVATFYGQFRLKPVGRNIVTVCHGTACHVAGAERISEALGRALGVSPGETTGDGAFTLREAACLGCCSLSPVVMVNATVHGKLTAASVPGILKRYR
jgi:NADH-quinone oxidoreductase subunit E